MLDLLYTSTKAITGSIANALFLKEWDCIFYTVGYDLYKVFRDGTVISKFGGMSSNVAYIATSTGRPAYWNYFDGRPIETCKFTIQPVYSSPISEHSFSMSYMYVGDFIAIDKRLVFHRVSNGRIADVYDLDTGVLIKTITFDTTGTYYYHYAGEGRLCAIATNGSICIYDYISDEIVQQSILGTSIKFGVYDCNYDVILVIDNSGYIRVYSLDESGDGLSAPTFLPTGSKYLYSGYRLTTRLTGVGGSPIANKWISWELVDNKGFLEFAASITDENGYAYNYYWCPTDISEIGSETVRVWCDI